MKRRLPAITARLGSTARCPVTPRATSSFSHRETDFRFVSRLALEEEGIYYYFRHELGKHTLVFADSIAAHDKYPGLSDPYLPPTDRGSRQGYHLDSWRVSQEIQPAAYVLKE